VLLPVTARLWMRNGGTSPAPRLEAPDREEPESADRAALRSCRPVPPWRRAPEVVEHRLHPCSSPSPIRIRLEIMRTQQANQQRGTFAQPETSTGPQRESTMPSPGPPLQRRCRFALDCDASPWSAPIMAPTQGERLS